MTVFVVHPVKEDLSSALVYGPLRYINTRYVYADELEGEFPPGPPCKQMLKTVDAWEPETDYLLIAGDHLQLLIMSAYLTDRWGFFRVLRYDRKAGGYLSVIINAEAYNEGH